MVVFIFQSIGKMVETFLNSADPRRTVVEDLIKGEKNTLFIYGFKITNYGSNTLC